jgi:hypothetical protein
VVSAANSLVGSTASDKVGTGAYGAYGVTALSNGNYVVASVNWDSTVTNVGAVTLGNGLGGTFGAVSIANSLVGSRANDQVGFDGITALAINGNYVVGSSLWNNGTLTYAGAVTWGSGTTGVKGAVSLSNSLVGGKAYDQVGETGINALSNGNYVVQSIKWSNGTASGAGAVTWGNGTKTTTGIVSAANSLVGSTAYDMVGSGFTALSNGNYVVSSNNWANGTATYAGAVT